MYRSKQERKQQQMKEGGKADKTDWFKKLGKDVTVTVPASVDSKLSQLVREGLEQFQEGEKYLVLEDGGRIWSGQI